jgi:hypothetical protein
MKLEFIELVGEKNQSVLFKMLRQLELAGQSIAQAGMRRARIESQEAGPTPLACRNATWLPRNFRC